MRRIKSLLFLMVAGVMASCGSQSEEQAAQTEVVIPQVRVKQVFEREVEQIETFSATVAANVVNNISPKMSLRIKTINVEVGDHVKKGQVLATMDPLNLTQAKLQMVNDSLEFSRTTKLYEVGGCSKSEWDARKLASTISRTNYENLLENTILLSPISGIVTARNYDAGDMYAMAQPLYTIAQITPVKLNVNVSESLYTQIKKGMNVDVKLDVYGDEVFKGVVKLVYPTIDPATRTFPVEVVIPNHNERVKPGMFARVTFSYGSANHVVVPDQAVIKQTGAGDKYVYAVEDGKVVFKKVELGRRMDTEYELLSGVKSGDVVITEGHARVVNGAQVEVVK